MSGSKKEDFSLYVIQHGRYSIVRKKYVDPAGKSCSVIRFYIDEQLVGWGIPDVFDIETAGMALEILAVTFQMGETSEHALCNQLYILFPEETQQLDENVN